MRSRMLMDYLVLLTFPICLVSKSASQKEETGVRSGLETKAKHVAGDMCREICEKFTGKSPTASRTLGVGTPNLRFLPDEVRSVIHRICGARTKCPSHYIWRGDIGLCYKIHSTKKDKVKWLDAERRCQKETEGGRLVILNTVDKNLVVAASLQRIPASGKLDYYVGARRTLRNGAFLWTDGQAVNKELWCPGEPRRRDDKCGSLWVAYGFCLDDVKCTHNQSYICEKPLE